MFMDINGLRIIPKRNYFILGIVIIVTILLLYYFYMWFDAYKETKLNMRILDNYMEIINYNELDNYLIENPDAILYVSMLENNEIREFEKKLKKKYKSGLVNTELLYLDITEEFKDKKLKDDMLNKYFIDDKILPMILEFKDGKVDKVFSIKDNNYDIELVLKYINGIGKSDLNG